MGQTSAVLTLLSVLAAQANAATDYIQMVEDTPCAFEYRMWFFGFRRSDFFVAPAGFNQEQCDQAAKVSHAIDELQRLERADLNRAIATEEARIGNEQYMAEQGALKAKANAKARAAIANKKPGASIGMTAFEVVNHTNWGRPTSINSTTTARGTTEQWVYGVGTYLYFQDGKLTTIQQAR